MATTNYGWTVPIVGGSADTWGSILNIALEDVDSSLFAVGESIDGKLTAESNLSDVADLGMARGNLGLEIDVDVLGYSARLASIGGLGPIAANRLLYTTGEDAFATTTITSTARTLLAGTSAANMRQTLELGSAALKETGTSGSTVPLLTGANYWSGLNRFDALEYAGNKVARIVGPTGANAGRIRYGTQSAPTLADGEIYLQHEA